MFSIFPIVDRAEIVTIFWSYFLVELKPNWNQDLYINFIFISVQLGEKVTAFPALSGTTTMTSSGLKLNLIKINLWKILMILDIKNCLWKLDILADFEDLSRCLFTRYNNFLGVCLILVQNRIHFDPPEYEINNLTDINCHNCAALWSKWNMGDSFCLTFYLSYLHIS